MAFMHDQHLPPQPPMAELLATGEVALPDNGLIFPAPSQPMDVARSLITHVFSNSNGETTITFWRNDWWRYRAGLWRKVGELDVKYEIYTVLESSMFQKSPADDDDGLVPWNPTPSKVHNVLEPLKVLAHQYVPDAQDAPTWITPRQDISARDYVPVANGLLNMSSQVLEPHTPALFSTYSLPFEFDAEAQCPTWERFLQQIFDHDKKGVLLLQEFAGYIVSGRIDLQKGLLIVGPSRAGKGVISSTLKQLVGSSNAVSPSLRDFATDFGLAGMIGKPLASIEDARGDDERRNNALVESLLNIIAGDTMHINRKNQDHWSGVLPTRLMLFSNETPRFLDASGAVINRFMAVQLKKSFLGKEDPALPAQIHQELPGILNWALEGAQRLEDQGRFTQPDTMSDMLEQMKDQSSPVTAFINDHYTITGNETDRIPMSEVLQHYKNWCEHMGTKPVGLQELMRRINASGIPGVSAKMKDCASNSKKRKRERFLLGVTTT